MERIKVIIEWTENNYGAASDDVLGCVATHKTLEGVKKEYASALQFHLEGMKEKGDEIPLKLRGNYELVFESIAVAGNSISPKSIIALKSRILS